MKLTLLVCVVVNADVNLEPFFKKHPIKNIRVFLFSKQIYSKMLSNDAKKAEVNEVICA